MNGPVVRIALRLLVGGFQSLRRSVWFFTRPPVRGAHAIPFTSRGTVVLVKLRYARGWRLPGGGRKDSETAEDAALRELREEIGMVGFGTIRHLSDFQEVSDFRPDTASVFIVRDVEYSPRWSLEVEDVDEFPIGALPADTSARTLRWLAAASCHLQDT